MPKAITYKNTKSIIPRWSKSLHIDLCRGYAYEDNTHFVHYYGVGGDQLGTISPGLTALEKKSGTLEDWVIRTFGAEDIEQMSLEVGQCVKGVWRPSLFNYKDTYSALSVNEHELRLSENALRLLINKLDDIFLYIEPSLSSQYVYSHKTRELLILACTEIENFWKYYVDDSVKNRLTTRDYVKLCEPLHLKEYEFTLNTYSTLPPIRPFEQWDVTKPTVSLPWYDAYNKTKHDRENHFSEATLMNCINAVVACLVMHCVKFSPHQMFDQNNIFSSLVNQHFKGQLINVNYKNFYLFRLDLERITNPELLILDVERESLTLPFNQLDFKI